MVCPERHDGDGGREKTEGRVQVEEARIRGRQGDTERGREMEAEPLQPREGGAITGIAPPAMGRGGAYPCLPVGREKESR